MRQFLYRIQPTRAAMLSEGPTEAEAAAVKMHFGYLQALVAKGVVLLAGRTTNADANAFGIVIFRARDEEAARQLMESDPAVQEGVMVAQLFPYQIALVAPEILGDGFSEPV